MKFQVYGLVQSFGTTTIVDPQADYAPVSEPIIGETQVQQPAVAGEYRDIIEFEY